MPANLHGLRIGFVGTGVMGGPMAGHLLRAGADVTVTTRTAARAQPLLDAGARWAATPSAAAADADVVITIVGYPHDVQAVYFGAGDAGDAGDVGAARDGADSGDAADAGGAGNAGDMSDRPVIRKDGILAAASPGALLIDMTTSRPALARTIHAAAAARGAFALDAPVSGGDIGAREATLSIMVGGDPSAFDKARSVLLTMGRLVIHQGPAGAGQLTKLCNQIAIAGTMFGALEALLFARAAGLDPSTVLTSIGAGAAASWTLVNLYPRAVDGDFAPGFAARHFLKDLRIALEEARAMSLDLPGLSLAEQLYTRMVDVDLNGDLGTHGLYLTLKQG